LRLATKESFFRSLNKTANVRVRSGTTRWNRRQGLHQKGVDVLLAVDVLSHVLSGATDHVTLVVSDLDFYPIFDALHQTRVKSHLVYSGSSTSDELIEAADTTMRLTKTFLLRCCEPAFYQSYFAMHVDTNWSQMSDLERQEFTFATYQGTELAASKAKDNEGNYVVRWNGQLVKSKYLDFALEHFFGSALEPLTFSGGETYPSK
jgi:hypothetical protein